MLIVRAASESVLGPGRAPLRVLRVAVNRKIECGRSVIQYEEVQQ